MKRGVLLIAGLIGLVVIIILVVVLVRSGRNTEPDKQSLKIWIPFDEVKAFEKASEGFLAANANISLEYRYVSAKDAAEYEAKVVNEIANGTGPDIWMVRSDWVPKHAPKSLSAFTADQTIDPINVYKETIEPSLVDLNVVNGKLYGVPVSADSLAYIYNSTTFNEVASTLPDDQEEEFGLSADTWTRMSKWAQLATTKNQKGELTQSGIALGTSANTYAATDVLTAMLNQQGADIISSDGKNVVFNLAIERAGATVFPASEAIANYTSYAKPGNANFSWSPNSGDPINEFVNGKVKSFIGYYTAFKEIEKKNPDFEIRLSPFPQLDGVTDENREDFAVTWSFIANSRTSESSLAWRYLSIYLDPNILVEYATSTGRIDPTREGTRTPLTERTFSDNEADEVFRAQFATAKPYLKPEWQLVDQILQDAINQVVLLDKAAQTSADSAAERLKTFVQPDA